MSRPLRFDNFRPSSDKASKIASRIKSSETKGERLLRSTIWKLGLRFRKNVKSIPGKPDIVFPKERVIVFCDGDFWHGRDWEIRKNKLKRGSNAPYWLSKIKANIDRDRRRNKELACLGWKVIRLWETEILKSPDQAARKVLKIVLSRRNAK